MRIQPKPSTLPINAPSTAPNSPPLSRLPTNAHEPPSPSHPEDHDGYWAALISTENGPSHFEDNQLLEEINQHLQKFDLMPEDVHQEPGQGADLL